jgi:hypothetical protein
MVSGIAHLLCPSAFESVNRMAFEEGVRAHVLLNGSIEAGLGLAVLNCGTRRAALAATVAYLTYFNASLLRRQRFLRQSSRHVQARAPAVSINVAASPVPSPG